jgi:hypothetical protein
MSITSLDARLHQLSEVMRAYQVPVCRHNHGVWADLEFTSAGPYNVGELVEYSGGSNIQVDKGEPSGLYLFIIYAFGSDSSGHLFYEHMASYPVVATGADNSGYSPIIKGAFGPFLGPGQYSFTVVIKVIRPNSNKEEELARKVSPFFIEQPNRRGGDGPNPLFRGGQGPLPLWQVIIRGGEGPNPLGLGGDGPFPLTTGPDVVVQRWPQSQGGSCYAGSQGTNSTERQFTCRFVNNIEQIARLQVIGAATARSSSYTRNNAEFVLIESPALPPGDYLYGAWNAVGELLAWGKFVVKGEHTIHFFAGQGSFWQDEKSFGTAPKQAEQFATANGPRD